ncbi:MAG TPA: diaminopimelate decarboxylase [Gemmatimonadaceae bacterium]|nr:diaminopimelate decarboxylase [Gemmatimonadaceae bacterium]
MGEGLLTEPFAHRDGVFHCEDVPAEAIAIAAGTPTFVYSAGAVRDRYRRLAAALDGCAARIHCSLKANANRALLVQLRELGAGVDVVSGGELARARAGGFAGHDIVCGGVGKTAREICEALEARVKLVNVESLAELELVDAVAGELGVLAPVGIRVNPEVTVTNPHHYIATGERGHKFGIPHAEAMHTARAALGMAHVRLVGLDMHVGSQLATLEPYRDGVARLSALAQDMRAAGAPLRYLDVGGGLPVAYAEGDPEPDLDGFGEIMRAATARLGLELIVEPGRFIMGTSGVLLTRVLYRKENGGRRYVIVDAGMNDLLRPSHYDAYHRIDAVRPTGCTVTADVVGPVCETGDFLALGRDVDDVAPGDLMVVHGAGAYGYVMSSNYNARPRAAEAVVDGHRFAVVTRRETYEDLMRLEVQDPDWRDA